MKDQPMNKQNSTRVARFKTRAKKAAATGVALANIYTAGDISGRAAEGNGSPKDDLINAASIMKGKIGWIATAADYAQKAYNKLQKESAMKLNEGNKQNKLKKRDLMDPKKRSHEKEDDEKFDPRRMMAAHNRKKAHDNCKVDESFGQIALENYKKKQPLKEHIEMREKIREAFQHLVEGNLDNMRENIKSVLSLKVEESLNERRLLIAKNYFAQTDSTDNTEE